MSKAAWQDRYWDKVEKIAGRARKSWKHVL